jgi:hypothetical protein
MKHLPPLSESLEDRFWKKVSIGEGCWLWIAGRFSEHGYGKIKISGRNYGTHVVSWLLSGKSIPATHGVLHKCDVRPCVRPSHLFTGTYQDNSDDKVNKRRHVFGDNHPSRLKPHTRPRGIDHGLSKLTDEQVRQLRQRYNCGCTQMSLAETFGISKHTVSRIVRRITWQHVGEEQ